MSEGGAELSLVGPPVWKECIVFGDLCLPQNRWLLSPLSQHAPRSSKVSYLKWSSGADWVTVTGDSRWGLGDSGQGFKLDTAGLSVFPGQSLNLQRKD